MKIRRVLSWAVPLLLVLGLILFSTVDAVVGAFQYCVYIYAVYLVLAIVFYWRVPRKPFKKSPKPEE